MEETEPLWRWPQKINYLKPPKEYAADLFKSAPWILIGGTFAGVIGYWEQGGIINYGLIFGGCFIGALAGIRWANDARETKYIHYRISRLELCKSEIRHTFLFVTRHYKIADIMSCPKYRHDTESFHFIYRGKPIRAILRHIPECEIESFLSKYESINANHTFKPTPENSAA